MLRILTVRTMENPIKEEVLKYLLRETGWLAHIHSELTFFPWKRTYPATLTATDGHAILFWPETEQKPARVICKTFCLTGTGGSDSWQWHLMAWTWTWCLKQWQLQCETEEKIKRTSEIPDVISLSYWTIINCHIFLLCGERYSFLRAICWWNFLLLAVKSTPNNKRPTSESIEKFSLNNLFISGLGSEGSRSETH